jgi:hypothetical protein
LIRYLTNDKVDDNKIDINESITTKEFIVPTYYPGLNLIPITDAGIWGKYDVAFQANMFYVLGSIVYTLDSFYMISDLNFRI